MIRTHYENLQVTRNASDIVIRAAYKGLAQKYHPDKFDGTRAEAERVMKILNEAYAVLSDPTQRKQHDEWIDQELAAESARGRAGTLSKEEAFEVDFAEIERRHRAMAARAARAARAGGASVHASTEPPGQRNEAQERFRQEATEQQKQETIDAEAARKQAGRTPFRKRLNRSVALILLSNLLFWTFFTGADPAPAVILNIFVVGGSLFYLFGYWLFD